METQQKKIALFLKLDPKQHQEPKDLIRDVSDIGHFGTGDIEATVRTAADLARLKPLIQKAYESIGA